MRAKNTAKSPVLLLGLFCLLRTFALAQESTGYAPHDLKKWAGHSQPAGSKLSGHHAALRPASLPPDGPSPPSSLRQHFSVSKMPFFCRVEHNLGLKTQVPIKFRLGSVEYVDWLERKGQHFIFGNY